MPISPTICIGNLSVGGTGKTPMVGYCVERLLPLLPSRTIWLLSRGYKRKLTGPHVLKAEHSATEIGDEPYLLARKYPGLQVIIDKNRARATKWLSAQQPAPQLILMDDGFQHRSLRPSCTLLLSTYGMPFFRDHLLPLGYLREPPQALKRAQALIFTKCPAALSAQEKENMKNTAHKYGKKEMPVFFSYLKYKAPIAFGEAKQPNKNILLLTGIADPNPLICYLKRQYRIAKHLCYADHFHYSPKQLYKLQDLVEKQSLSIFTTEKDYVKIAACMSQAPALKEMPWFYVPMHMSFGAEEATFHEFLLQKAQLTPTLP